MRRTKTIVLFLILLFVLASCATNISSIKKVPKKYLNKTVIIKGIITKVNAIPLTSLKIAEIYDKTDTVYVLTNKEVKKNKKRTFKGEIIPIGPRITKEKARFLQMKVAKFLVDNNLASPRESLKYARKIMEFLRKIVPKNELTLLMLDHKVKK